MKYSEDLIEDVFYIKHTKVNGLRFTEYANKFATYGRSFYFNHYDKNLKDLIIRLNRKVIE